mmetsp:Transcript_77890/g.225275  ORF Transcript_77890/g.225275 Transcript_77890/m.225275 type:complete len:240 (+) Transcript_77890:1521-2240(+)
MVASPSSSFAASGGGALPIQPMLMAWGEESSTLKSRTLYKGERIAACNAQPRATLSSWFIVVDNCLPPRTSEQSFFTQGTRELPPTISTESICSGVNFDAAKADSNTAFTLAMAGAHIDSKSSRVIWLAKSASSIKHSTLTGASEFADKIFLVFMTASSSLKADFLLLSGSQPFFFSNCAAKARMRHSSSSRPPTLSDFSQTTVNLPRTNCTTVTENNEWPMEQKATVMGLSGSKSFDL